MNQIMRAGACVLQRGRILVVCILAGLLAACAQTPKDLYDWQAYQPSVYAYLKEEDADFTPQVQVLESGIEAARTQDATLPPGFRAHLGMLYVKLGQGAKAVEQWQAEKLAFPEGAIFMDFLLRNVGAAQSQVPGDADAVQTAARKVSTNTQETQ